MTHEIDSAFDKFQRYTTNDVQRTRCRRSTDAQFEKNYVIDVLFLFLDKRDLDLRKNDDFKKHHAFENEKLFNE